MKHTLRAFLALSLLAALCLLALVVAGWFALIVYLVVVRDVPARALFFPFLIGLVGLYVVLAVTRASSRLSRTAPLGLVLPEESQTRVWQRVRDLADRGRTRTKQDRIRHERACGALAGAGTLEASWLRTDLPGHVRTPL